MDTSDFIGRCLADVEHQMITAYLWVRNGHKIVHLPKTGYFSKRQDFFKNLASSVTRHHGQLSCTISKKNNNKDPILRKLSDRRRHRQTRWTQEIS